ncbi:hypothetical protein [Psychroflexus sediminis]|uniref:Lipoprotein n=1 Tax=Psychroflexus sediminis TaxID=470826 RepID=A0A1G7YGP8_9FLAO|nr:hypothetical protein [Psychroflexus sediminis]SDG95425.1 hypothetical protein SAMN04488027_11240 [Psychroflexus sediminis]
MKLKSLLAVFSFLALWTQAISCADQKKEEPKSETSAVIPAKLQEKINLDSIQTVKLSEKAKRKTEEWIMYIALNSEMERLENYTISDVINNSETIENVVDSLSVTVPPVFETNAVNARILSLKTHVNLLNENTKRIKPNPGEIKDLSAKLKLDFNNLNIQLNEVFIIENSPVE